MIMSSKRGRHAGTWFYRLNEEDRQKLVGGRAIVADSTRALR